MKQYLRLLTGILIAIAPLSGEEHPFSLFDAIAGVLANSAQVESLVLEYQREEGVLKEAAEPFDTVLTGEASHLSQSEQISTGFGVHTDIPGHATRASALATKQLRAGTVFRGRVDVNSVDNRLSPLIGASRQSSTASLSFEIEQPLLRNFRWGRARQIERARRELVEAVRWETLQSISNLVLETVSRYWTLVAAKKILIIQEEAEARAKRLLENTRELIQLDEIPRNDENQALAQLERERINRIGAHQSVIDSYQGLALLLGDAYNDVLIGDHDLESFPDVDSRCCQLPEILEEIVETGLQHRYDLLSVEATIAATEELVKGQCNELLPELNAFTEARSLNFQLNDSSQSFPRILNRNNDQIDITVGIRFSYPFGNSGPRGRLKQQQAELQRLLEVAQRTSDQIVTEVQQVISEQESLAQQISHAEREVEINTELREAELEKLKAGSSTLFVVVDYEQRLTVSQRELMNLRARYATGIARLYALTGTLLSTDSCWTEYAVANLYNLEGLL